LQLPIFLPFICRLGNIIEIPVHIIPVSLHKRNKKVERIMRRLHTLNSVFLLITALFLSSVSLFSAEKDTVAEGKELDGKRVAILITEGFHDGETMFPMGYLQNQGALVTVVGPETGVQKAYNSEVTAVVERSVREVSADHFDALVIPGGRSPANLREHSEVVDFVRFFIESGKPTASICHGPQVVIATGMAEGRTLTAVSGIRDEITKAGAVFTDREVMADGNLITSRFPSDLPAFSIEIKRQLLK
jgi:protease I